MYSKVLMYFYIYLWHVIYYQVIGITKDACYIIFERAIRMIFIFPGKIKNLCNLDVCMDFRSVIGLRKNKLSNFMVFSIKKKH